jgi:hypothetical protein
VFSVVAGCVLAETIWVFSGLLADWEFDGFTVVGWFGLSIEVVEDFAVLPLFCGFYIPCVD